MTKTIWKNKLTPAFQAFLPGWWAFGIAISTLCITIYILSFGGKWWWGGVKISQTSLLGTSVNYRILSHIRSHHRDGTRPSIPQCDRSVKWEISALVWFGYIILSVGPGRRHHSKNLKIKLCTSVPRTYLNRMTWLHERLYSASLLLALGILVGFQRRKESICVVGDLLKVSLFIVRKLLLNFEEEMPLIE